MSSIHLYSSPMFVETKESMLCGQSCSKRHRILSHIGVTEERGCTAVMT